MNREQIMKEEDQDQPSTSASAHRCFALPLPHKASLPPQIFTTKWTMWMVRDERKSHWEENLQTLFSLYNMDDYWHLITNIKSLGLLPKNKELFLFKAGIRPVWEDAIHKKGGRWLLSIPEDSDFFTEIDITWMFLMLFVLREPYAHCDKVCGVAVSICGWGYLLSVWTTHLKSKEVALSLGEAIRDGVPHSIILRYQLHKRGKQTKRKILYLLNAK